MASTHRRTPPHDREAPARASAESLQGRAGWAGSDRTFGPQRGRGACDRQRIHPATILVFAPGLRGSRQPQNRADLSQPVHRRAHSRRPAAERAVVHQGAGDGKHLVFDCWIRPKNSTASVKAYRLNAHDRRVAKRFDAKALGLDEPGKILPGDAPAVDDDTRQDFARSGHAVTKSHPEKSRRVPGKILSSTRQDFADKPSEEKKA